MSIFAHPEFDDHEHISFFRDVTTGLRAIVAIHASSELGLAGGGCRMWPYPSDDEAIHDVLRLSKAMSYKLVLAGLPAGGAKCVVIADPRTQKTSELLRALGRAVHRLAGRYVIAEDVGTTPDDMEVIARETPYVAGRPGGSGNTTGPTAYGTFIALRGAVERRLDRRDLAGLRVAIQGVGGVGFRLGELLVAEGAQLVVTDVDPEATRQARAALGADVVAPEAIFDVEADVFAPCALGGILTERTVDRLRCAVVAGAANNQLVGDAIADRLQARQILYAPDFIANMGGVIGASTFGKTSPERLQSSLERIAVVLTEAFDRSDREGVTPHAAAVSMARDLLAQRPQSSFKRTAVTTLWRNPAFARLVLKTRNVWTQLRG